MSVLKETTSGRALGQSARTVSSTLLSTRNAPSQSAAFEKASSTALKVTVSGCKPRCSIRSSHLDAADGREARAKATMTLVKERVSGSQPLSSIIASSFSAFSW